MGRFAWFGLGVCLVTLGRAAAAQSAPTGTFPPAQATAASATAPLPPPPPPPPSASTVAPTPPSPSALATGQTGAAVVPAAPPAVGQPPAPPPGYRVPYPGYSAYPPPGYGYYYPPPTMLRPNVRLPNDAAVSASPFVDVLVASVSWENRVSQFLNVGVQVGAYVAGRVRLSANVLVPTNALTDSSGPDYSGYLSTGYGYVAAPSKPASAFFDFGLGVVAVSTPTFLLSPGLVFGRTDVSDYGSSLAAAFPLEWVTASGMRLGFEFDAGRAFGGSYHEQCVSSSGLASDCGGSAPLSLARPSGTSVVLQFQLGFGFNHPDPLPPKPGESGWPAAPTPAAPAASAVPAPPPS